MWRKRLAKNKYFFLFKNHLKISIQDRDVCLTSCSPDKTYMCSGTRLHEQQRFLKLFWNKTKKIQIFNNFFMHGRNIRIGPIGKQLKEVLGLLYSSLTFSIRPHILKIMPRRFMQSGVGSSRVGELSVVGGLYLRKQSNALFTTSIYTDPMIYAVYYRSLYWLNKK